MDLLESSLALDESGIRCSTLPGYATARTNGEGLRADIGSSQAVIALLDEHALHDPQLMLELGVAFTYDKRMMLLVEGADRHESLPGALRELSLVERVDSDALVSMVEDLAFELGLRPRIGDTAHEAIRQLSSAPPPSDQAPSARDSQSQAQVATAVEVPAPAPVPAFDPEPELAAELEPEPEPVRMAEAESPRDEHALGTDEFELADDDLWMVDEDVHAAESIPVPASPTPAPLPAPHLSSVPAPAFAPVPVESAHLATHLATEAMEQDVLTCVDALEAGRSVSECSFHRDQGGDFAHELEATFGRFVDAVGGDWSSLRNLDDVEVWLAATDNLLEGLPSDARYAADWYELGYQFSTLRSIAEGGLPADPAEHQAYAEIWQQSMEQFWRSAESLGIAPDEFVRVRNMLENLLGPEAQRDYTNLARSLQALREHAAAADHQRSWFG